MSVRIVTDSSSCLPAAVARELDITVLPLHTVTTDEEQTTSGLSALELAAAYGRQLERGGDDGVVAIHLAKELSSTWSAATTAAGVFDGLVRVIDTDSVGMVLGEAAISAARAARRGADLDECAHRAARVTGHNHLWLYVNKADSLRKSGRMTTGASLFTSALPVKPIFELANGSFGVAARTRTQAKALERLVEMVVETVDSRRVFVAVHQAGAEAQAQDIADQLRSELPNGSKVLETEISPALRIHTGPSAIAVSAYFPDDAEAAPRAAVEDVVRRDGDAGVRDSGAASQEQDQSAGDAFPPATTGNASATPGDASATAANGLGTGISGGAIDNLRVGTADPAARSVASSPDTDAADTGRETT